MRYLKVLVICLFCYFFYCYGSNDGNPSLAAFIPQSPALAPSRGISLGSVVSDELSSESPHSDRASQSSSKHTNQGRSSVIFADESAAAESPNLGRKEAFSNRKTQRRDSVVAALQPINIPAGLGINTPRHSAKTAFDNVPNLGRPSSSGIGGRRSAVGSSSAGIAPDSAATTPRENLLSTPMAKQASNRYPSPPEATTRNSSKYTSAPKQEGKSRKINARGRQSIDLSELRRPDFPDDEESCSDDSESKSKANASGDQNEDSAGDKTNIVDNKTNKPIFYILAAVVVSFSILYKTNKKFYNKVNYYWEKIKSKIKFLYSKDSDSKPKTEQTKDDKTLSVNTV